MRHQNQHRRSGWAASCVLSAAAALGLLAGDAGAVAPAVFKAGFAERDVSPAVGAEQPGDYVKATHKSFHDACKARAAVFDDGSNRVAVVGLDALFIRGKTVREIREAIEKKCGIPAGSILISASHSHSAGPTGLFLPGEFDHASPEVRSLVYDQTVCADPAYLEKVKQGVVEAVCEADARRVEARCGAGFGIADNTAFNRRFLMKQGHAMTHPGQGNPDIIKPAGPTDPQVGVIGAWSADGKLLGCIVNFACHATTGPGGISADYVYYIEKTIRGLMGDDAVVVFVPGMAGDVTQVDNRSPYQIKQFGEVSSRFVGGRVGAEALKTLLAMEQHAGPLGPVKSVNKVLKIKRRVPSPAHVAEALELIKQDPAKVDRVKWTFAKETVVLDARIAKEPVVDVEVQAVQVGPAVFLTSPAEYFCQYGLDLKAGSKFPFTFPVSLANDVVGYVPHEDAMSPTGGGYETRLTSYSNLEPTAGRQIADALLGLAATLTPGAAPKAPALPPFKGQAWGYGNLPPQLD
jgi:neutral ceramidase